MSKYSVISNKQIVSNAILTAICLSIFIVAMLVFKDYLDLPDVYLDMNNKCVKVENYKNGDAYTCQDLNIILKKYHAIKV